MSPGGLNGSGVHALPQLDEPRPRRRPWVTKLLVALGTAAISVGGAMAAAHFKNKEGEVSARAVVDQRLLLHDQELKELRESEQLDHKAIRADIKKLSDALLLEEPPTPAILSTPRRHREPQ